MDLDCIEKQSDRRYILAPEWSFRGWKLLPYAIQCLFYPKTEFFDEKTWALISACDGQTKVHWDQLSEEQQQKYDHWEKQGFIRRALAEERLTPDQAYRFYPARFKESVQWSVTGRCNFRCRHCFISAPHAVQGEPEWGRLMHMLSAFERCGIRNVSLTGGEPLIRKDFWPLVDEITARGITISTIYTNGLLVTDDFLNELDRRGLRPSVHFSFDGVGWHDWMRGVKGAEQAVISALKRCRERGIRTDATMVMFRDNRHTLREAVNLLSSLGCGSLKTGIATPAGEWAHQPEHFMTQAELYEAYLDYIPKYFEDGAPLSLALDGFFVYDKDEGVPYSPNEKDIPEERFPKALVCGHARRDLYVSPVGNVLPCMSLVGSPIEAQFPNMLDTPLEEILDDRSFYMNAINYRVSDFMAHNPECSTCEYRSQCCGGCRAQAVFAHPDDYLAVDPATCEYFRGGWKDKKDALLLAALRSGSC